MYKVFSFDCYGMILWVKAYYFEDPLAQSCPQTRSEKTNI